MLTFALDRKGNNMATEKTEKMNKKMEAADAGLGKSSKTPRHKKTTHTHIEPSDNKGFMVHHIEHEDGIPTGKKKHHVFPDSKSMHKHIVKTYPMQAAAEPPPDASAPPADPMAGAGPAGAAPPMMP